MKRTILSIMLAITSVSCDKDNDLQEPTPVKIVRTPADYNVQTLFIHDDVTLFKVWDPSNNHYVYFTKPAGMVSNAYTVQHGKTYKNVTDTVSMQGEINESEEILKRIQANMKSIEEDQKKLSELIKK